MIRNADLLKRLDEVTSQAMLASGNDFYQQGIAPRIPAAVRRSGADRLVRACRLLLNPFNVATAAENMLLQATELGLGSCFLLTPSYALNAEQNSALAREAGIPEGYAVQCAVAVGYTADETKFRLAQRNPRVPSTTSTEEGNHVIHTGGEYDSYRMVPYTFQPLRPRLSVQDWNQPPSAQKRQRAVFSRDAR